MGAGDGLCSPFMRVLVSHGGGPLLAGHRWRWWGVALAIIGVGGVWLWPSLALVGCGAGHRWRWWGVVLAIVGVDWGWWWVLAASRVTVCCCM